MTQDSLIRMFVDRARLYGPRTALRVKKDGTYRDISWTHFLERVRDFALGLRQLGVKAGDTVCLLSENRPEWAYADLAILALGAVNVPIYPTSSGPDIDYILRHSDSPVLIFSGAEQYEKIKDLAGRSPKLKHRITFDPLTEPGGVLAFDQVCRDGARAHASDPARFDHLCAQVGPEDLATIIYTSGTTGQPKGVMLTHRNFLSNVEASVEILKGGPDDRCLSFLPLSHVFERMAGFYFMLYQGVSIAYAENMNTVPQNILEIRPTMVASVPRLYEKIYARILEQVHGAGGLKKKLFEWSLALGHKTAPYRCRGKRMPPGLALQYRLARKLVYEKIKAKLGGRIRFFISGGAPLSKEIAEFFFAADLLILEGYGLTETSPVVSVNRPDDFKFGTVGKLLAQVEVKIASDGEILVRGPNVMRGYYKMERETHEAIVDGWFRTGDIGEFDTEGFLKITDRKKDLIVTSGGKNIAPQKIENLLVADEYILQVCVCGDRKNYLTALVVPDFGPLAKFAEEQGIAFVNCQDLVNCEAVRNFIASRIEARTRELANYERIKQFTLLAEEFCQDKGELTPTLKIKRKIVTEKYRAVIEAMYEIKSPA